MRVTVRGSSRFYRWNVDGNVVPRVFTSQGTDSPRDQSLGLVSVICSGIEAKKKKEEMAEQKMRISPV